MKNRRHIITDQELKRIKEKVNTYEQICELETCFDTGPYPVYSIYFPKRGSACGKCVFRSEWLYDLTNDPTVHNAEYLGKRR